MRILHLLYESKGDYFGIGGVGMRAYEIYRRLRDRHSITLLCKKYPGAEDREVDGLRHIFVGSESRSLLKSLLSYAWQAGRFVSRYGDEFDIVVEEFSPAIPTVLPWTFKARPVILQVQGFTGGLYFSKYNPAFALFLYLSERVRPHFYDSFIFASLETEKKFFPDKENPSVVIPNGISPDLLQTPAKRGTYLLYYGRIDMIGKGLDLLLKAYLEFSSLFPYIKLVVAGDGRDMPLFEKQIKTLPDRIQKQIDLLGWISDEKKPEVIGNAICAIFPSRHEVQGICVLEAMACGKPVIVSSIPEFSYVTENRAGISFMTGDHASLTEAMKEILHSNDRDVMGQNGRNWVRDFTWDRIALRYEDFLRDVAAGKGV